MKQPIFEHGSKRELDWMEVHREVSTTTLNAVMVYSYGRLMDSIEEGKADTAAIRARNAYRNAREIERRELAIVEADMRPKWIEQQFDDIQHHRLREDYPGQMSDTVRPGRL